VVAVTDYEKALPGLVARWVPREYTVLGTDGFGRSDTRAALRRFFEIDAEHIVFAVLSALCRRGEIEVEVVRSAQSELGISPEAPDPATP
jgi:pyruvate dehydrogenase E1 component